MELQIKEVINQFILDLEHIIDQGTFSVIIYGSVVMNDYIEGLSDIDFIVLLKEPMTDEKEKALFQLHRSYREGEGVLKQLQGVYYEYSDRIQDCLYIGSVLRGFRRLQGIIHSAMDIDMIGRYSELFYGQDLFEQFFLPSIKGCDIEGTMIDLVRRNLYLLDDVHDVHFYIYSLFTVCRSIYYKGERDYCNKSQSIWYVIKLEAFNKYRSVLFNLLDYRVREGFRAKQLMKTFNKKLVREFLEQGLKVLET